MLTKAVEPGGGGKIAPLPQLVHILDNLFKHANRAFHLPMPELPFQRLDFLVDDREDPAKDRPRADDMVGDLLHGPDLHRQVKPVDNMRRRFGQRLRQPLHDFGAMEKIVTSPCPEYPSNWRACSVLARTSPWEVLLVAK